MGIIKFFSMVLALGQTSKRAAKKNGTPAVELVSYRQIPDADSLHGNEYCLSELVVISGAIDVGKTERLVSVVKTIETDYRNSGQSYKFHIIRFGPAVEKPREGEAENIEMYGIASKSGHRVCNLSDLNHYKALVFDGDSDISKMVEDAVDDGATHVIFDEAQFLTRSQMEAVLAAVEKKSIKVILCGLQRTFQNVDFDSIAVLRDYIEKRKDECRHKEIDKVKDGGEFQVSPVWKEEMKISLDIVRNECRLCEKLAQEDLSGVMAAEFAVMDDEKVESDGRNGGYITGLPKLDGKGLSTCSLRISMLKENGKPAEIYPAFEGATIVVGGCDMYVPMCHVCYKYCFMNQKKNFLGIIDTQSH